MVLAFASVLVVVSPDETAACGNKASAACLFIYRQTHNDVLARAADWLIARPLKILLLLILASIASWVLRRVIQHNIRGIERASVKPGLGFPGDTSSNKEPTPHDKRTTQRAETLGAVMLSFG